MASTSSSATPRLLPHQLVPRDARSSYIKRVETLAGPGAYVIPSGFKLTEPNPHIREIHKQQYGREFARQWRQASANELAQVPDESEGDQMLTQLERRDRYLARRERLRELLEKLDEPRGRSDSVAPLTMAAPLNEPLPLPQSPSLSCTSNYEAFVEGYRRRSSDSSTRTTSVHSVTSPTSIDPEDPEGFAVDSPRRRAASVQVPQRRAASPATSPPLARLTYRAYLATTSYRKHLQRRPRGSTTGGPTT